MSKFPAIRLKCEKPCIIEAMNSSPPFAKQTERENLESVTAVFAKLSLNFHQHFAAAMK